VWLEVSADGGATWSVPASAVTGAVGLTVTPGANLRLTWNAGQDWNGQTSNQTRFRVKADDLLPDLANFAAIPGGNFQMGDPLDGMTDAPVYTVNVSAFYMQKKAVTKAQWDTVRTWAVGNGYGDLGGGAGKAEDHPVQTVTWYDVVKWCNARSQQEGLTPCYYTDAAQTVIYKTGSTNIENTMVKWSANGYRLPTEAEWEKAARGGLAGKRFPWGDTISHSNANFCNVDGESYQTGTTGFHPTYSTGSMPYTSPVGSFAANGYGLYHMSGNVWQWCWDWYGTYAAGADPRGVASGSDRVRRGGGWGVGAYGCRAAYRNRSNPSYSYYGSGFRPVRR
jgi:formylglycine-generating enzyme required for sulfatase activity